MTSVELRRVSKVYSGTITETTTVLDEVDLRVDDGELLVLLGPNGSGKTTLLRLIAGLERVTAGEVLLGDQVVNDWSPRRRNVAMVFQSGVLYPHLTVKQNLRFGTHDGGGVLRWIWSRLTNRAGVIRPAGTIRSSNRSDEQDPQLVAAPTPVARVPEARVPEARVPEDRVRETTQLLGIESLLNRLPRQLSGGERQRVALGRALVRQPAAFLLDEPLANADAQLRRELRVTFQRARERFPGTMILVSHDHREALALGHRIAVLGAGKVQQVGLAQEVFTAPRNLFVAEFLGRSALSFIEGERLQQNETNWFTSEFGRVALPAGLPNSAASFAGPVILGLPVPAVAVCRPVRQSAAAGSDEVRWIGTGRWSGSGWSGSRWSGSVRWVEWRDEGSVAYVAVRRVAEGSSGKDAQSNTESRDNERTVLARVLAPEVVSPGDQVQLEVDWSRALWFDRQTGNNLAVPQ